MKTIFRAYLDTGNFEFEAYGEGEDEARAILRAALIRHAKEYGLSADWFGPSDELSVLKINMGCAYRDRSRI